MKQAATLNFTLSARKPNAGKILLALRRAGGRVGTKLEGCIGLVVHLTQGGDVQEVDGDNSEETGNQGRDFAALTSCRNGARIKVERV